MSKEENPTIANTGQFQKGNQVGKETRFAKKNILASKYKDEYCDQLIDFFAEPESTVLYEEEYYSEDKGGGIKKRTPKIVLPPKFPTFEMFAASIGVTVQTLLNWCESHPRFLIAYEYAKNKQLGIAKDNGVRKNYDSNFTKFILVNDHGLSDKVVQEQTQDKPFEVNINVVRKSQG